MYHTDFPGGPVAKTLVPNAGGLGLIPGQGTRSPIPQLRMWVRSLKEPSATTKTLWISTKTWCSQIIFFNYIIKWRKHSRQASVYFNSSWKSRKCCYPQLKVWHTTTCFSYKNRGEVKWDWKAECDKILMLISSLFRLFLKSKLHKTHFFWSSLDCL